MEKEQFNILKAKLTASVVGGFLGNDVVPNLDFCLGWAEEILKKCDLQKLTNLNPKLIHGQDMQQGVKVETVY